MEIIAKNLVLQKSLVPQQRGGEDNNGDGMDRGHHMNCNARVFEDEEMSRDETHCSRKIRLSGGVNLQAGMKYVKLPSQLSRLAPISFGYVSGKREVLMSWDSWTMTLQANADARRVVQWCLSAATPQNSNSASM